MSWKLSFKPIKNSGMVTATATWDSPPFSYQQIVTKDQSGINKLLDEADAALLDHINKINAAADENAALQAIADSRPLIDVKSMLSENVKSFALPSQFAAQIFPAKPEGDI